MADPIISDIFKFVAVRPADLITPPRSARHFIDDARTRTDEGQRHLKVLARTLASPQRAREFLQQADRAALVPLEEGRDRLLADYRAQPASDPLPSFEQAGGAEELLGGQKPEVLAGQAFDLLYAAWLAGADTGRQMATPTAALQLLHFLQRYQAQQLPDVQAAREALLARPLIYAGLHEFITPPPTAAAPPTAPSPLSQEKTRLRPLFEEYATTRRLLAATRADIPRKPLAAQQTGQSASQQLLLSNLVRFGEAMAEQPPTATRALLGKLSLNDESSLPQANRVLQQHLTGLTQQVLANQGQAVRDLVGEYGFKEIGTLIPGLTPPVVEFPAQETAADVDMSGRLRPLGIGDLIVVKQQLVAYQPGEVAHIENVLQGEFRERSHRMLDRSETILFQSEEDNQEAERDTQSTDRFELKKEAEKSLNEEMNVSAGVTVSSGFGPVKITAKGDFAYKTASEESNKNSSTFAHEVVDRAISKVQKRVKSERTDKTFHEVEEINKHGIDNKAGDGNITGVYRWVDKKYHAQLYNYGKRLMLEFIVPEPAAYYRASQQKRAIAGLSPPTPFRDLAGNELTPADITEDNYHIFAGRYSASVEPPPPVWAYVSATLEQSGIVDGVTLSKSSKELIVPDGYVLQMFTVQGALLWHNFPQFTFQLGEWSWHWLDNSHAMRSAQATSGFVPVDFLNLADEPLAPKGTLVISIAGYDVNAYAINVAANCLRTPAKYQTWQATAFDKIRTAWQALQTAYEQKVAQAEAQAAAVVIEGRNPAANREIEKGELKKLCITMLTGQHYNQFNAMTRPTDIPAQLPELKPLEALAEGRYIQFFEQAFEWTQMTYLFYPYFWARKANWLELSNLTDNDPLFAHFLQSGAARVVVPVPLEYSEAVLYFLQKNLPGQTVEGKLWGGGQPPTLDDPEFKSIAYEIRLQTDDLYGATPLEPKAAHSWDFTLPTTLVWLQSDSSLPTYPVTL